MFLVGIGFWYENIVLKIMGNGIVFLNISKYLGCLGL